MKTHLITPFVPQDKYKQLKALNKALNYCFPITDRLRQKFANRLNCMPYEIR